MNKLAMLIPLLSLTLFATPLAAQTPSAARDLGTPPPPVEQVETLEEEGGLSLMVNDTSDWQNLVIAIAGSATDRDQPTAANASGTAALGKELATTCGAALSPFAVAIFDQLRTPVPVWE